MGVELTATLTDGDTPLRTSSGSGTRAAPRSSAHGANAAYLPDEGYIGDRLTAKATYMDGEDANNKKMAEATTMRAVRKPLLTRTPPRRSQTRPPMTQVW